MKEINKKYPTPLGNFTHCLHLASAGLILQIKLKEQGNSYPAAQPCVLERGGSFEKPRPIDPLILNATEVLLDRSADLIVRSERPCTRTQHDQNQNSRGGLAVKIGKNTNSSENGPCRRNSSAFPRPRPATLQKNINE